MREAEAPRYFLPLSTGCLPGCRFCARLGCRDSVERDLEGVRRAVRRAAGARYGSVLFASSLLGLSWKDDALAACRAAGLRCEMMIDVTVFRSLDATARAWIEKEALGLDLVFDGTESPGDPGGADLTVCAAPGADLVAFVRALPSQARERLQFHFSRSLPVKEVYRRLARLKRELPDLSPRPPRGREVWDPAIPADLCLEPDVLPIFRSEARCADPSVSVVIPAYNSRATLREAVRQLFRQDLPKSDYEIIVVDDGSTDGTAEEIRACLASEGSGADLAYLYFPRARARRMGDGSYRAGIARNLGAKRARGRVLSFLDADILVPPDFLSDLLRRHERWDVVQCVRLHLREGRARAYESIDPARDAYILEKDYWGRFFGCREWESLPFFWKYTCTYALSLPRATFERVGRFGKTFVHYGFEDTDLGYRLARAGCRFHLSERLTYHLPQGHERSEYARSNARRRQLLSKTAKTFYLNQLDPAIFEHFQSYMLEELSLRASWGRFLGREGVHA